MSCLVIELDVPGLPDNPHFSIGALVTYCLIVLLDSPGVVGWHCASKHQRGSVTHRDRPGGQAESNSARTNESDGKGKLWILIVLGSRKLRCPAACKTDVDLVERERCV